MRGKCITVTAVTALLILVVLPGFSAQASTGAVRPPPPSASSKWALPLSAAPLCSTLGSAEDSLPTVGGWSTRRMVAVNNGQGDATKEVRPYTLQLHEPCRDENGAWRVVGVGTQLPYSAQSQAVSAQIIVGRLSFGGTFTGDVGDWTMTCAFDEWSTTQVVKNTESASQIVMGLPGVPRVKFNYAGSVTSGCNYLVSMKTKYCTFASHLASSRFCATYTWTAETWFGGTAGYKDGITTKDGQASVCAVNSQHADCVYLGNTAGVDGSSFAAVCAYAPVLAWGDWGWLKDFVGHYARCLTVPVNGWDRESRIGPAWEQGAGGEITGQLRQLGTTIDIAETCGNLVEGNGTWDGLDINTCTWSSWAGTLKFVIHTGVLVAGAFFIVSFVTRTLLGVVTRKTPSPIVDD